MAWIVCAAPWASYSMILRPFDCVLSFSYSFYSFGMITTGNSNVRHFGTLFIEVRHFVAIIHPLSIFPPIVDTWRLPRLGAGPTPSHQPVGSCHLLTTNQQVIPVFVNVYRVTVCFVCALLQVLLRLSHWPSRSSPSHPRQGSPDGSCGA